nr:CAP domain-containing protein [Eubacterium sp.]
MKKVISLVLSIVMLMSISAVSVQSFAGELTPDSDARAMLTLVNNFRTGSDAWCWNETNTKKVYANLTAYKYDVNLEAIAKIRAKELEQNNSHTRPDGSVCFDCTVKDANGKDVMTYGENIAMSPTYESAFNLWCETEEPYDGQDHRRNMLSSSFTCIGIAGFKGDDGNYYWVQEFGYALSAQPKSAEKKANTLTAKGKAVTVKKNKKTVIKKAKAFAVNNAKGAVTFTKSKGNKKITVAKNGKITVNKGLKKGTYKVKVKVKAAGN